MNGIAFNTQPQAPARFGTRSSTNWRLRLGVERCVFLMLVFTGHTGSAQVQLDRFYPPVVSVGGEGTVTAEGKFPAWPVQIVCDRDEINVVAAGDSGTLQVVVPADASPGVAWIRMHDKSSASKLVPLLIDPQQASLETEPNDSLAEATKADQPCLVVGRLERSGDVDTFHISARGGQTLVVSATAHGLLRSPMDAVLQLVDDRGNVIVQSDDDRGLDPQIVYEVPGDSEFYVRIFAFPETPNSTIGFAGSAAFVYMLRVTTDAFVDHVLPLVACSKSDQTRAFGWNLPGQLDIKRYSPTMYSPPVAYATDAAGWQWQDIGSGDSTSVFEAGEGNSTPTANALPCVFSGHVQRPHEIDRLRFRLEKGKSYRATVHSRHFGLTLDSVLRLVDAKVGNELARNDDRAKNEYDAVIEYTAKADADAELEISDLVDAFGPRHAYSVLIEESTPTVTLTIAEDHFAVNAGESVEIPVTISRQRGFTQDVRVVAEGLPPGVEAEPIVSETKGDSSKSVKLTLSADKSAAYQGTFRILGHALDGSGNETNDSIAAVHSLRDRLPIKDVWLTVVHSQP